MATDRARVHAHKGSSVNDPSYVSLPPRRRPRCARFLYCPCCRGRSHIVSTPEANQECVYKIIPLSKPAPTKYLFAVEAEDHGAAPERLVLVPGGGVVVRRRVPQAPRRHPHPLILHLP